MALQLTAEQQAPVDAFASLVSGRKRRLCLGGHAGTGKTEVIRAIVDRYGDDTEIVVCTPTGKAAHVLRAKGVDACTIHSLIYRPHVSRKGELSFERRAGADHIDVAIVDEASMLSAQLVRDFERRAKAVMYVGDHGQLEPIGEDPGLMRSLDIRLEQVHRQAAGSPIIQFAHNVREGNEPETFGDDARVQYGGSKDLADFDVVLCGYNDTRLSVNAWIRKRRSYTGALPKVGEQVICLRNNKDFMVWNGMTAVVTEINEGASRISVDTDDGPRVDLPFDAAQFGAKGTLPYVKQSSRTVAKTLWDFGYCLTVHKSQGSEWDNVAVKEEIASTWSPDRWRYTAATRASKQLRWVL